MLQTLDPHSSFLDPRTYAQMRERQEGRYYGLGITIQVIDGDITAVSLFEGSPAYKKGVRRGDVIAQHRRRGREGLDERPGRRGELRGPKGTTVKIALRRQRLRPADRTRGARDEINIPTIPAAFMIDATTGYVRLQDFAEQTDDDLGARARDADRQGHEAAAARPARQPRRSARPGHPGREPVPAAGRR